MQKFNYRFSRLHGKNNKKIEIHVLVRIHFIFRVFRINECCLLMKLKKKLCCVSTHGFIFSVWYSTVWMLFKHKVAQRIFAGGLINCSSDIVRKTPVLFSFFEHHFYYWSDTVSFIVFKILMQFILILERRLKRNPKFFLHIWIYR